MEDRQIFRIGEVAGMFHISMGTLRHYEQAGLLRPVTSEEQFPVEFKEYIAFLENYLQTPIKIISIGPDRAQTIVRK